MKMGRPRQFDRDEAVRQAMHLFWERGFDSTSLSQLKSAIGKGITAPSFYAAFGSKEKLFQEAVECYLQSHGRATEALWHEDLSPREAIESTLLRSSRMQCEAGHPKGCMVALGLMTVSAAEHQYLLSPLEASRKRTSEGFVHCVQRGVLSGELQANTSAEALGLTFSSFLTGISTLARDGVTYGAIERAVRQVMQLWDSSLRHRPEQ